MNKKKGKKKSKAYPYIEGELNKLSSPERLRATRTFLQNHATQHVFPILFIF